MFITCDCTSPIISQLISLSQLCVLEMNAASCSQSGFYSSHLPAQAHDPGPQAHIAWPLFYLFRLHSHPLSLASYTLINLNLLSLIHQTLSCLKLCSYSCLCLKWELSPWPPIPISPTDLYTSLKTQLRWHLHQEAFSEFSSLLQWLPMIPLYYFSSSSLMPGLSTKLRVIYRQGQCFFVVDFYVWTVLFMFESLASCLVSF